MYDDEGGPCTEHTTNPVPLVLVDPERKGAKLRPGGRLSDVAPTLLALMGLEQPAQMTGKTLVQRG